MTYRAPQRTPDEPAPPPPTPTRTEWLGVLVAPVSLPIVWAFVRGASGVLGVRDFDTAALLFGPLVWLTLIGGLAFAAFRRWRRPRLGAAILGGVGLMVALALAMFLYLLAHPIRGLIPG